MVSSRLLRRFSTHIIAVAAGVGLTLLSQHILTSREPLTPETSTQSSDPSEQTLPTSSDTATSPQGRSFVADAIALSGDAVVEIDTQRTVTRRVSPFFNDPFSRRFPGQLPQEREIRGQGSGFIIEDNGIILTNAHVVSEADQVTVTLKDGRQFDGMVLGADEVTDLAVVKIEGDNLPVAPLGDSDAVTVGDWAIAVGNPVGLDNTVTLGIISTLDRSSVQAGIPDKRINFLQTDAAINPGNSGGPLLNEAGEVIGINTAIRANAMGIGFAIPINQAKEIKDILIAGEQVPHPYLGIRMITLTPEIAKRSNENPNTPTVPEIEGVLVMEVLAKTPAALAGLRSGDVITEIAGQRITEAAELQMIVENAQVGEVLPVEINRDGQSLQLEVIPAQLSDNLLD